LNQLFKFVVGLCQRLDYKLKDEKAICPICFKTNKEHKEEYQAWEKAAKNAVVYNKSGKPL